MKKVKNEDQVLSVKIADGKLVISIGINVLCFSAENCERFYDGDRDKYTLKVTNKRKFAGEIVRALEREEEDGTTPVHVLLDNAFEVAMEDGCEGVKEPKR